VSSPGARPATTTDTILRSLLVSADLGGLAALDTTSDSAVVAVPSASSAAAIAAPSRGRPSGCLASIRPTSASSSCGTPLKSFPSRGTSSNNTFASTAMRWSPRNAGVPVRHSNSTHPSENTSARASTSACPRACSGAMYPGVPTIAPVRVIRVSAACHAIPKSSTFTRSMSPSTRNRFEGFRSRCTTPPACAKESASATRVPSLTVSLTDSAPRLKRSDKSSPSSHSMARNGSPAGPTPCATYRTMAGWRSSESTSISRAKRPLCADFSPSITLTATASPVTRSKARKTSPIPPAPASRSISNRPPISSPSRIAGQYRLDLGTAALMTGLRQRWPVPERARLAGAPPHACLSPLFYEPAGSRKASSRAPWG
jgi:hypothetical protein